MGSGIQDKKNLRIRAGRCKIISTKSVRKKLTNQYLWDSQSINALNGLTSEHSQQLIAKCKQRCELSFPGIILRSPVGNYFTGNANLHHNYINLKRPGLESAALSRTITGM